MVELVHDDDVPPGSPDARYEVLPVEALDRGEQVVVRPRGMPAAEPFPERAVPENGPVGLKRLVEDLVPVGDEEKARAESPIPAEAPVIEGRHHRLTRPGRRDDEVLPLPEEVALRLQLLEDFLLERVRVHVGKVGRAALFASPAASQGKGALETRETLRVRRVDLHELRVVPERVERGPELLNDCQAFPLRSLQGPLEPLAECGCGEIRRPDVDRRETARATEEPCLRVQARASPVEGNADPRARHAGDGYERFCLARAGVGRGQEPKAPPAAQQLLDRLPDPLPAPPRDEADDGIDLVRALHLRRDLRPEPRLVPSRG